ncbi:restriction endonuclease subunit S [bacterium]|nr:restriction endonuclease subunit S [bacterium]
MMRFSIPKSWRKKKLADIADVQTGIAKGKKNIADPVTRPYLRVANVQDGHLDLSEIKTIEVSRHELDRFSLKVGDVLFTEGGDFDKLGRGTVWQGEVPNCLHQNHVFAVRMKNGDMLPYFLATYAASFWGRTYFLSCSKQTTNLASINSTQLKEMPLPVPPLPEQRKIAAILSTWDRSIELTEKLIVAKQRRKQALMQQLLTGKVRLPRFHDEWTTCKAGNLFAKRSEKGIAGLPTLSVTMQNGLVRRDTIDRKMDTTLTPEEHLLIRRGDIAYNMMRMWQGASGLADENGIVSPAYVVLSPMDTVFPKFAAYFFKLPYTVKQFEDYSFGLTSDRLRLYYKDFSAIKMRIPPLGEQEAIADFLLTCDSEIKLLEARVGRLASQKNGLMQQLLTGKIRVQVDDAAKEVG